MLLNHHLIKAGYEVSSDRVNTLDGLKAALETQDYDVILAQYELSHFSAMEALYLLKEKRLDTSFIIISTNIDEETAVQAIRSGASDYVMKDNPGRLILTIERELQEAQNRRALREAVTKLRESEDRYRDLVENSHDLICTHDLVGHVLSVNQMAAKILGYKPERLIGRNIRDALPATNSIEFDNYISTLLKDGVAHGLMAVLTSKGEKRIWEYTNTLRTEGVPTPVVRGIAHDVTEQKRFEKALKVSEAELRALFGAMTDLILVVNAKGHCLRVAQTKFVDDNKPPREPVGTTLYDVFPKEQADYFLGCIKGVLNSNQKQRIEYSLAVNEKEEWFEGSIVPFTKDSVIWVAHDVTEKKQTEKLIQLQATALKAAANAILITDVNGIINWVNPAFTTYTGYTAEEIIGQNPRVLKSGEQDEKFYDDLWQTIISGDVWYGELINKRKDGSLYIEEQTITPVRNEKGQIINFIAIKQDVTERKKAEDALAKSAERYRTFVENAHDVIFSHDLNGNFTAVNKAVEGITGYKRKEILKMNIRETLSPEQYDKALSMTKRMLSGEHVETFELEFIVKRKRILTAEVNAKLILQNGVPVGVQGIARDITERKQLEEKLRQAQKMEAIGQLTGGIAHDFNNLLTAINGYCDLTILKANPHDNSYSYLHEIKKAGERAASLTRQLLAFSRKQILQTKVIDLNVVISDLKKMLKRVIGEDLELFTVLSPELGKIKADHGQIEQVIMNLAVNSRDAMPEGGKLIIETHNIYLDDGYATNHIDIETGHYVMLTISDTGVGMDRETQSHIFEPFFTTKEIGRGTGLGLATVYGIVRQSKGYITLYSEVGIGTTFKIYLPRIDEETEEEKEFEQSLPPQGTETILLVEDDVMVRELVTTILEDKGYKILVASNGKNALSICEQHDEPIHLLLTDVIMPEMNGRKLAKELSKLRPKMKVIYMSGYTDNVVLLQKILAEETNFIQKPFAPKLFARKVRDVLDADTV